LRIALISEGPSGKDFPGVDGYDEVVGVNGMPSLFPCTWWVFIDKEYYVGWMNRIIGRPHILTTTALENAMKEHYFRAKGLEERWKEDVLNRRLVFDEQVPPLPPMPLEVPRLSAGNRAHEPRWTQYTGLAGLVCCWMLADEAGKKATVDVWGVDMCGEGDAHDRPAPGRSEARWETERRIWSGLVTGFETSGDLVIHCPAEKR